MLWLNWSSWGTFLSAVLSFFVADFGNYDLHLYPGGNISQLLLHVKYKYAIRQIGLNNCNKRSQKQEIS